MSLTLKAEAAGLGGLAAALKGLPDDWDDERTKALKQSGQQMVKVWKLHLSGPAGPRRLSVQTGRLRNSIAVDRARSREDAVIVGSDAPYARRHEFGLTGTETVRAHLRREHQRRVGGEVQTVRSHVVKTFSRIARTPKRPHRAPAVRDHSPAHVEFVAGAVDAAVKTAAATAKRLRKSSLGGLGGGSIPTGRR